MNALNSERNINGKETDPLTGQIIPIPINKFIFEQRESCRKSAIASGIVLINTIPLAIVDLRRFDALKYEFIYWDWYEPCFVDTL